MVVIWREAWRSITILIGWFVAINLIVWLSLYGEVEEPYRIVVGWLGLVGLVLYTILAFKAKTRRGKVIK